MKVLLINPPGWQKHSINLGLAYLAGSLWSEGIEVQILDMNNHVYLDQRLHDIVSRYGPKIIGVSVKTATANASIDIFCKLKNYFPDIIYVAGGPHITLCGKEFMEKNKEIDFGFIGEGEVSFNNFIKNIKDKEKGNLEIPDIYYRRNGDLFFNNTQRYPDISKLRFPRFEHIKDMDFADFMYPLLTSRGCPYGCIFCCVGIIFGKKWRAREPEDVVSELLDAKERYKIASFEIMDDNFTFDIDRAKKICRLLIKKKLNLEWWCHNGLRADRLDRELLFLMRKSGCKSIALGIESGDEQVFNNINKGEKLYDILKAAKMIKKAGIKCVGYFIIGLPGDSVESTKKTVKVQRDLGLSDYKYNMLVPYPGTKIWDIIKEKGRLLADIRDAYHFGDNMKIPFETDQISRKTMEQCHYLTNNQGWVQGEDDLVKIQKRFQSRFNRDIKKIIFIATNPERGIKDIEIEYNNAKIIAVNQRPVSNDTSDKYLVQCNGDGSYFDSLLKLTQESGYQINIDISKRKLFMQKVSSTEKEYVRGEILPSPPQWDASAKKYFATRLKYHSPDYCSPMTGIIYKDDITLPFSHTPQWEKIPCGKIESGLAFISRTAYNPNSTYKADYLAQRVGSDLKELSVVDDKDTLLEKILNEADILFYPESLEDFALIFSRAKINTIYSTNGNDANRLNYRIADLFSRNRNYYVRKKARYVVRNLSQSASNIFTASPVVIKKSVKVVILWIKIMILMLMKNIKGLVSKIVRF
ncbi:MAG: radical SAM protein [Candidatus Gorgyraea atricola]|nr:radical SAM protein [Candidatus Gorgyraea atricola]